MRTLVGAFVACLIVGACFMSTRNSHSTAAESRGKALKHIVMYKFKPEATQQQVQEVIDAFAALPKKIETVIGFEHGVNVSPENKSEGFTHCFVVTFRDEQGRDEYLKHPAHDDYVKVVRDRREKVIVFDDWGEK